MLLLDESHIQKIGIDWDRTIGVIEDTVSCMIMREYVQPVKPYLRYRDMKNRIIAMPAFVGGSINMAGIKWISSFPDNIEKGLPRAHSVVVLNNAETGEPVSIICTALLSIIRTVSVSGMMIRRFDSVRNGVSLNIGIIGFGPIGQHHLKMCLSLFGDRVSKIFLFDLRPIDISVWGRECVVEVVSCWEDAYLNSDIVITCTVSDGPYIDKRPKPGSLHLNVSLRDYRTSVYEWFKDSIIVDDWDEVCREKTDIEKMHLEKGLKKENTRSIVEVIQCGCLEEYSSATPIMFNPMGMAVFDIAIGSYYYKSEKYRMARSVTMGLK
jgi:ornithine cyclodeaminase